MKRNTFFQKYISLIGIVFDFLFRVKIFVKYAAVCIAHPLVVFCVACLFHKTFKNRITKKSKQDRVSIVQGGYVSQSANKSLSVSKKANILNKSAVGTSKSATTATLGGGNHASEGGSSIGSAPVSGITVSGIHISVKYCKIMFILVFFLLQEKDLRDITDEIRKLKAIIVKHENRIRALEAAVRAQEDDTDGVATRNANNNANSNDTKASDSNKKDTNDSSANNDNGTSATAASDDA